MKKVLITIILVLLSCLCFSQEIDFDWKDLGPFGFVTKENWKSIVSKRGDELCNISVECGYKTIGIWYLEKEPEYEYKVSYGKKRVVFLVQDTETGRFFKALSFQTCEDISQNMMHSNPFYCSVQGYSRSYNLSVISSTSENDIIFTDIEPYTITCGQFEWPSIESEYLTPFYFWDNYEKRVICVDNYDEDLHSLYVPVKNPVFYYGKPVSPDSEERLLYIGSTDGKSDKILPSTSYLLRDGKATKVVE